LYSGDVFSALGLTFLEGRPVARSQPGSPTEIVVSRIAARKLWPDRAALGQELLARDGSSVVVAGVVEEGAYGPLAQPSPDGQVYYLVEKPAPWRQAVLVARTTGHVDRSLVAAVDGIARVAPPAEVVRAESIATALGRSVRSQLFRASLASALASTAVVIMSIGIIGLATMSVVNRRQEVAIRAALGATAWSLLKVVAARHLRAVVGGVVLGGLLVQYLAAGLLRSYARGVTWTEPVIVAATLGLILIPAVLAGLIALKVVRRPNVVELLRQPSV
jgi:hypothetical protein